MRSKSMTDSLRYWFSGSTAFLISNSKKSTKEGFRDREISDLEIYANVR